METLNFFFQVNVTLIFSCFHFILSKTWFWFKDCCKQLDTQNKWWRVEKPVSDFEFFWVVQIRQCTNAHLKIKWNVTTKCLIFSWNYDFIFFFEKASRVKSAKRRSGLVKKIHTDRLFIFHTITSLWLFTFYQFKQILQQFFENLKIVILFFWRLELSSRDGNYRKKQFHFKFSLPLHTLTTFEAKESRQNLF